MRKRVWKVAKIILCALAVMVAVLLIVVLAALWIPHKRRFSSVYAKRNATYDNVVMFPGVDVKYQYQARHAKQGCYIDGNVELEEVRDDGYVWLKTRAIGIRTYKTDVMGIWVLYPSVVYECIEEPKDE